MTPAQKKNIIETNYWLHVASFPHGHSISDTVFKELKGIMLWAVTDVITSQTSLVGHSADDINRMAGIAEKAQALGNTDYSVALVGRLMGLFVGPRFLHYYGTHGARLDYKQSVHGAKIRERSFAMSFISIVLFGAPRVHLSGLDDVWIDEVLIKQPWEQLIEKLKDEWQGYVLLSTVLLNANVAFLAIPNVVPDNPQVSTLAEVVSYVSVVTSIGSIVISLLLLRQYRVKPRDNVLEALDFLHRHEHKVEGLAVVYSLPYALLMWGMITFLAAFCVQSFATRSIPAIVVTATAWAALVIIIVWCIYSGWEDIHWRAGFDHAFQKFNDLPQSLFGLSHRIMLRFRGPKDPNTQSQA